MVDMGVILETAQETPVIAHGVKRIDDAHKPVPEAASAVICSIEGDVKKTFTLSKNSLDTQDRCSYTRIVKKQSPINLISANLISANPWHRQGLTLGAEAPFL